jgi:hypothetical protein
LTEALSIPITLVVDAGQEIDTACGPLLIFYCGPERRRASSQDD